MFCQRTFWIFMIIFKIKELMKAKAAREDRKITMQEVADATGVNRSSLSKMANPKYHYSTSTTSIESLCAYFECDVGDLMFYKSDKLTAVKERKRKPKKAKESNSRTEA